MDKFIDKFNFFDIFTMLIPGIIVSMISCIALHEHIEEWFKDIGNEYIVFFVLSYFIGVILQEIGTELDKKYLYKRLYDGEPKKIFLNEDKYKKVLKNPVDYYAVKKIKVKVLEESNISNDLDLSEDDKNSYVFSYCMNTLEMHGLTAKSDKMVVISEMSRAIFWGNNATIVLYIIHLLHCHFFQLGFIHLINIILLLFISLIFIKRKKRYEQYRFSTLIRTFLIYISNEK